MQKAMKSYLSRPLTPGQEALFSAKSLLVSVILAAGVSGCAGAPVVVASPSSCATLLPSEWKQGVAGAPLPVGDTVADWEVFADATVGKLDVANGRTKDAIGIIERCEERDKLAIKRATRKWWQIF
jgi:hypothetical protein